jgi:AraC family transcriptional activator of pobA
MNPRRNPRASGSGAAGPDLDKLGVPGGVPTVDFYGDATTWPTSALLHSELLVERSQLHEWKIRAHRHSSLAQLFLLLRGDGSARFDGADYALSAPCVAVVPALCVHEFQWTQASEGFALSIASALIEEVKRQIGAPESTFKAPIVINVAAEDSFVATLLARIHEEYIGKRPMKEIALDSLTRAVAIWVARGTFPSNSPADPGNRANRHYRRFVHLVETHHRSQWTVANYAHEIGITAPHLNAICQKSNATSALRIIHERLLLAARRELIYTDRSIAGIAAGLGFAEPSYFTRFFKRHMATTPKAYRRSSGTSSR